ncbi:MAG TPA: 4Fe-4S dicluster domain-containing protein [Rhodospirillales bacterium]|nr:4Fe-4S dicluster domain-containing protein [Rhodospirillales bacterium]
MANNILITASKCTGCMTCEMACSFTKEQIFRTVHSRLRVFDFIADQGRFVPYICTQCSDAWCAQACPVDAISLDPNTKAWIVAESKCTGCRACTLACPFGSISHNSAVGKAQKCDLCGGNPACVEACPTDALTFVADESMGLEKMRLWAAATSGSATEVTAAPG